MALTILNVLSEHAQNTPNKTALISERETLTYAEFWKEITKCAQYLTKIGLQRGDMVLMKAAQSPNYLISYYSVQLAGGIPCAVERNTPSSTVIATAKKMDAKYVITEGKSPSKLPTSMQFFSMRKLRADAAQENTDGIPIVFPKDTDLQLIMFTTGTTGASKGVKLSFRAMQASEEKIADFTHMPRFRDKGMFITPTPLNHAKGIWETGGMLRTGGTVYILRGLLDLRLYFKALDYPCEKVLLSLVPANLRMLISMVPQELEKRADKIGGIKLGTAPLLEHDKDEIMKLLPHTELHNPYGSSEGGILCNYMFNEYPNMPYCIGKALKGTEVLVLDDDRNPIVSSPSNMGKLAFRSNSVMDGYYGEPELTAQILQDGVIYTNDYGYVDENGFVFVRGRADDVINFGGLKVAPDEVEQEAIAVPNVADCICIATEDEVMGSGLKLLVVMKEKGTMNPAEIRNILSKKLESYKVPKVYEEVDEIARTYNGKLNRKFYRH